MINDVFFSQFNYVSLFCLILPFPILILKMIKIQFPEIMPGNNLLTASAGNDISIDERINQYIEPYAQEISRIVFYEIPVTPEIGIPFVLLWLVGGGIFFTLYFKFVNLRQFRLSLDVVRGKYTDPKEEGEVNHFQALTTALSGTVGLGNIAGVAIAISLGGPGAMVWMIFGGLIGMSSKFVECTLGVAYRNIDENGIVYGGPMYYLSQGFSEKNFPRLGKFLAVLFAIMCIGGSFGGGNMFQANQAYQQFSNVMPESVDGGGWIFGLVIAFFVGLVIIGGIKSIAKVTEKIVPLMVAVYLTAALIIIMMHFSDIPAAFSTILREAINPTAVAGGFIGVLIQGFRRAAFSNEAGIGSASIAHSAVKTRHPASEGIVALLEPFIDTVVVCTMTALVIVITGVYTISPDEVDGVTLTSMAFGSVLSWFPYILSVSVIFFAFSTMLAWSYYGLQSWSYLFGKTTVSRYTYKLIFCTFIVIGAASSLDNVVEFSDAMIFAMCFPNILGLFILAPKAKYYLKDYLDKIRSGEIIRID
jgi:alanine or glycine:cation symporter, AGCS family